FVHVGRLALLDELLWSDAGWPYFKYGDVPSIQAPTPFTTEAKLGFADFSDDFTEAVRPPQWQWDFRHPPAIASRDGRLSVSVTKPAAGSPAAGSPAGGSPPAESPAGTFYGVAPAQGNYTATVTVDSSGAALKGMAAYGDAGN